MLIVLRKLLELVLMRKTSIYTEIPEERQACDKKQDYYLCQAACKTDRWVQRYTSRIISQLCRSLINLRQRLTSRCLRPDTVAAVSLAGEHGGEGSTHILNAVGVGSGEYAPGFFCNYMESKSLVLFHVCVSVFVCRIIPT